MQVIMQQRSSIVFMYGGKRYFSDEKTFNIKFTKRNKSGHQLYFIDPKSHELLVFDLKECKESIDEKEQLPKPAVASKEVKEVEFDKRGGIWMLGSNSPPRIFNRDRTGQVNGANEGGCGRHS